MAFVTDSGVRWRMRYRSLLVLLDRATVDPYPPWYTMSHGSAMTRPPAITGPVTRPPAFTGPGDTTSDLDLDPFSMSRAPGLFVCPIFGLVFQ